MRRCWYEFHEGMYHTDCGSKLIHRPLAKCDKCGRKPEEKAYAPNVARPSSRVR